MERDEMDTVSRRPRRTVAATWPASPPGRPASPSMFFLGQAIDSYPTRAEDSDAYRAPPPPLRSSMFAKHVAFAANIDAQASMAADKTQSRGPPPRARHAQVPPSNERRRHQTRLAGKANRSERRTGEGWDTAAAIRPCRPGLARLLASGEFASHPGRRGREGRKASCWLGPPGSMQRRPEQMRAAHRIYTSRIGIISRGSVQPGAERKGGDRRPKPRGSQNPEPHGFP
ncbi:hypothetical protein ACCO45_010683 [Purpureocillium lilacinum]|uniref:Uncharacterized protein n=1 Tax=Purpureocillium lilacinum TaxID=33203 RepID=A0ACC4DFL8_PURLI